MRTVCSRGLVLAACLGGPALAAVLPASAAAGQCVRPAGASVAKASRSAVVYARTERSDERNAGTAYWGCLRSRGRLVELQGGRRSEDTDAIVNDRLRLQGRFAAFTSARTHRGVGQQSILTYDLRSGQERRIGVGVIAPAAGALPLAISHLVLTARGHVAWRQVAPEPFPTSDRRAAIGVRDSRGRRSVDSGEPAAIARLQLVEGTVARWRRDGRVKRLRLR